MNSRDQDSEGATGQTPADPGRPDDSRPDDSADDGVTGYYVHSHATLVSELGKDPECREALDRLYHYLDGELTEGRRRQIKEHLETCMPCLEAFDFEAELKMLIARRCRDEVPVHLRIRVVQALAEASAGGIAGEEAPATGGIADEEAPATGGIADEEAPATGGIAGEEAPVEGRQGASGFAGDDPTGTPGEGAD